MDDKGGKQLAALVVAVERQATAAEKLLELAEREELVGVEPGPSVCPGCGRLNPEITPLQNDGSGPLDNYVLIAETHCCNSTVYCVPDTWSVVTHKDEALSLLHMKGRT
jgi:hypothetical protein